MLEHRPKGHPYQGQALVRSSSHTFSINKFKISSARDFHLKLFKKYLKFIKLRFTTDIFGEILEKLISIISRAINLSNLIIKSLLLISFTFLTMAFLQHAEYFENT